MNMEGFGCIFQGEKKSNLHNSVMYLFFNYAEVFFFFVLTIAF